MSLKSPVLELFFLVKYVELGHSETITTRLQIIEVAVGVYFFSFPLNFRIADIKMALNWYSFANILNSNMSK